MTWFILHFFSWSEWYHAKTRYILVGGYRQLFDDGTPFVVLYSNKKIMFFPLQFRFRSCVTFHFVSYSGVPTRRTVSITVQGLSPSIASSHLLSASSALCDIGLIECCVSLGWTSLSLHGISQ